MVYPPTQQAQLTSSQKSLLDQELERLELLKLQDFINAVKADTKVRVSLSGNGAGHNTQNSAFVGTPSNRHNDLNQIAEIQRQIDNVSNVDPTQAYQARLEQIKQSNLDGGTTSGTTQNSSNSSTVSGGVLSQSGSHSNGNNDKWTLKNKVESPISPYVLRAEFVIPGIAISGINSDLPGQIMAQVGQDVYDTPTGRYLLIPQGSRLVGNYSSNVAYGQSRVLVAWNRIIFPDGKSLDIGTMPGADSAGYSGFKDKVNNHYFRLFASAFLMSGVTAGISLSQERDSTDDRLSTRQALSEALGQQLGEVTTQLISKNLNIAPTSEIRPGFRFNLIVTKDINFDTPYQHFHYSRN